MKNAPSVFVTCTNSSCKHFEQQAPTKVDEFGYVSPFCPACHSNALVDVRHGDRRFSSYREFEIYASGLGREYKLIKRVVSAGIATKEELAQAEFTLQALSGLKCSCCNQPFIPEEPTDIETKTA